MSETGPVGGADASRPRRRLAVQPGKKANDVDHWARSDLIRRLVESCAGGIIPYIVGVAFQLPPLVTLIMFLAGSAFTFGVVTIVRGGAVGLVVGAVAPSGDSTPHKPEYSQAKAYAVRGQFVEAVHVFERAAEDNPDDPEPPLHLARIYRDEMREYDKSVEWFRQALSVGTDVKTQNIAIRELADVFMNKMKEPKRALPDLARFAHRHAGTPTGDWATKEIAEIKKEVEW